MASPDSPLRGDSRLGLRLLGCQHSQLSGRSVRLRASLFELGRQLRLAVCNFSAASVEEEPVLKSTCWRARSRVFCSTFAVDGRDACLAASTLAACSSRCAFKASICAAAAATLARQLIDRGPIVVIDDFASTCPARTRS